MTILVFAPHADDEVLGVGGSISRWINEGHRVVVAVLTGPGEGKHPLIPDSTFKIVREECIAASKILGISELIFKNLPALCLDYTPIWKINSVILDLIHTVKPVEVYVPFPFDLHKDHAAITYGVNVATRPYLASTSFVKRVLAYETLSETHVVPPYPGYSFQPNVFVNIEETIDLKLKAMKAYHSQLQPDGLPRSLATIKSLANFRGSNIGCSAAEAFMLLGEYIN